MYVYMAGVSFSCVHVDVLLAFRVTPARFPQDKPQAIQTNTGSHNV